MIDVTAAIIVQSGKVLAARRKPGKHLSGYWEFPGGKIEKGESPEECLVRELSEELGIEVRVNAFIGESKFDYGNKYIRLLAYKVEHVSGDFKLLDHDEIRWLAMCELDDLEWAPADLPIIKQYKAIASTFSYYENNASEYCNETINFDVRDLYENFLDAIPKKGHILDLGCGSGRDSKAFLKLGYQVTALDLNAQIAEYAQQVIGRSVKVHVMDFQEMEYIEKFEGIWACASLLHCTDSQNEKVLEKISIALKQHGVAFFSFKWGEEESIDIKGRYFNNFTKSSLMEILEKTGKFEILKIWTLIAPLRGSEQKWVNALVKRL